MSHDFESVLELRGTDSVKWRKYAGKDILPMWVADMDFRSAPEIITAIQRRAQQGVFGYGEASDTTVAAVLEALWRDYAWKVRAEELVWLPGVNTGLELACRALTAPNEAVLTSSPVYVQLTRAPRKTGRALIDVPLAQVNGRWEWDWSRLESQLSEAKGSRACLLMLCHPHNPTGRVWSRAELEKILALAERHDLIVCSDEIHCGLLLEEGDRHVPFATLGSEAARRTMTLMSPSKTFNLPGLGCAFAVVSDPAMRERVRTAMTGTVPRPNVLGLAACEAAYREGEPWRKDLLRVLRANRNQVIAALSPVSGLGISRPEATSLLWIDVRRFCGMRDISDPVAFFEAAGVGLLDGAECGARGFVRLNYGCPQKTLDEALARILRVV